MSRFYGDVQGSRGKTSRTGSKAGIKSHTRGWNSGVEVIGEVDSNGNDTFTVFQTGGSNGACAKKLLGYLVETSRGVEFVISNS